MAKPSSLVNLVRPCIVRGDAGRVYGNPVDVGGFVAAREILVAGLGTGRPGGAGVANVDFGWDEADGPDGPWFDIGTPVFYCGASPERGLAWGCHLLGAEFGHKRFMRGWILLAGPADVPACLLLELYRELPAGLMDDSGEEQNEPLDVP